MGKVKEIEVSYKRQYEFDNVKIGSANDAYKIFMDVWDEQIDYRESVNVMYLDRSNKVKFINRHSVGSTTGSIIDVKQILALALKTASESFIVAHNHPSGNLRASNADRIICEKLRKASETLDMTMHDFMIVTSENHLSII
jgi:DNA repair protein RadC